MDEQQKKIERERYQFSQLNLPKPKTTSPTESQNKKPIWCFSVQKCFKKGIGCKIGKFTTEKLDFNWFRLQVLY